MSFADLVCAECIHLLNEHERLEQTYAVAVTTMNGHMGISSASRYFNLRRDVDLARRNAEIALRELEQHQRIHAKAS